MKQCGVFIGNTSKNGIYYYKFRKGNLIKQYETKDFERCTYLANSRCYIYSVIEVSDIENDQCGYILSYKKNKDMLKNINKKSSYGKGPCHIEISKDNKFIYVSNYIDGYVTIFKVNNDGAIGDKIYSSIEDKKESHLHCIKETIDGKFFFVSDLGADLIIAYEVKDGEIQEVSRIKFEKDTQPRHIVVSKDKIFVITEKSCKLYILKFTDKKLEIIDSISILPKKKEKLDNYTGCAIKLSKDHKFLYLTIRGDNSINVYKIKDNFIKLIQNIYCNGDLPRDLEIDKEGKYILIANQNSNDIAIFKRNKITGKIKYKSKEHVNSPTCIIFE